jgi:hypothetical protein
MKLKIGGSEAVFRTPLCPKIALVCSTCVAFAGAIAIDISWNYDRFSPRRRYKGNLFCMIEKQEDRVYSQAFLLFSG